MKSPCCQDCRYCWQDDRSSVYRRPPFFFCRRKGSFFSRNYQIGEGTRIDPRQKACEQFSPKANRLTIENRTKSRTE